MGLRLLSTPPASAATGSGEPRPEPGLGVSVATPTPSLRARRTATSLCSLSRLVAAGVPSPHPSSGSARGRELSAVERAHAAVRSALHAAYVSRWSSIIAVAAQRALAGSLLELPLDTVASAAGELAVHEVLQDERWLHAPAPNRLPQRP